MTKPFSPMFMPAPRPASRLSQEDAQKLLESTADLGFGRPSTDATPDVQDLKAEKVSPSHLKSPTPPQNVALKKAPPAKPAQVKPVLPETVTETIPTQTLRLDVPESVWRALKLESLDRKVTVKYLILEALLKAGYPVDLTAIPEDGRRLR